MLGFAKGDRVSQPQYGCGTIVEVNEHHTVIDFDDGAVRRFVSRLVTLEPSGEPAPKRQPRRRSASRIKKA